MPLANYKDKDMPCSSNGKLVSLNYVLKIFYNFNGCTCCSNVPHVEIPLHLNER